MGRLIDADICLKKAWQNFYKQEEEHEKLYEDYDILRDRHFEQCGFECCQQTIVNTPTVEAIPKADYEARLKADMVAMLTELRTEIDKQCKIPNDCASAYDWNNGVYACYKVIQQKINALKGELE